MMVRGHIKNSAAAVVILLVAGCNSIGLPTRLEPVSEPRVAEAAAQPPAKVADENRLAVAKTSHPEQERHRRLLNNGFDALGSDETGYYMDIQEARLRQEFSSEDIVIQRDRDIIRLVIPGQAMFEKNSVRLNPNVMASLDSIAQVLSEYSKTLVAVEGFTDNSGVPDYNQHLSEQRALSAGSYLAKKGVDTERLIIVGYGDQRPLANNSTEAGRAMNRRIELTLYPLTFMDYSQAKL